MEVCRFGRDAGQSKIVVLGVTRDSRKLSFWVRCGTVESDGESLVFKIDVGYEAGQSLSLSGLYPCTTLTRPDPNNLDNSHF